MTRPLVHRPHRRAFYNIKTGRGLTRSGRARLFLALRKIIVRTDKPPVVALMECAGNWTVIRRVAKRYGYRIFTGTGTEGSSTALLVRDDVKVLDHGLTGPDTEWTGPRGRAHPGRAFPWARVQLDGVSRTFVAVHMPWNRRKNAAAFDACLDSLRQLARDVAGAIEFMADWNVSPAALAKFVRSISGYVVHTGDPLMYAVVRPAGALPARASVIGDAKTREGSDHPYAVTRDVRWPA